LAQLRYLIAIIDSGLNITLAADRVHATQPGLSKQLKLLEEELGFQIFVRKGKSLERLSPAGVEVVDHARLILDQAGAIRALAANHRQEARGELRLLTSQTQAQFVLPSALTELRGRFPDVRVRLSFTEGGREPGDHDLAIVSTGGEPPAERLVVPLYRWNRVALAPTDHPLAMLGRPLTLADLAAYPLIGYDTSPESEALMSRAFARAGHAAEFAYVAEDSEVIKTYVRSGLGVGVIPEMAAGEPAADLTVLDIDGLLPISTTWAVLPGDRVLRDYVAELVVAVAPHIRTRDLHRLAQPGDRSVATLAPHWRNLPKIRAAAARAATPADAETFVESRRLAVGC